MGNPTAIKTIEMSPGLTLDISDPELAQNLTQLNKNHDQVLNLADFPPITANETDASRQNRMREAVVAAMRCSNLFKNSKHYDGMLKFFRSFEENRKGHVTQKICPNLKSDTLFQTSTLGVFLEGGYKGKLSIESLKKHGTLGVGTYDHANGEMVGDGKKLHQVDGHGKAISVPDHLTTPFAVTTHFKADKTLLTKEPLNVEKLQAFFDTHLPQRNIFYAFKITGNFKYLKTRSVPEQKEPYPPFSEVVKTQPTFEFHNQKGTIVGFWTPKSMKGINATGYHFHFITADKKSGGHLLELRSGTQETKIEIDYTCGLRIDLSKNY